MAISSLRSHSERSEESRLYPLLLYVFIFSGGVLRGCIPTPSNYRSFANTAQEDRGGDPSQIRLKDDRSYPVISNLFRNLVFILLDPEINSG